MMDCADEAAPIRPAGSGPRRQACLPRMGDDDSEDGACDRTFAFVDEVARLRSRQAITKRLLAELKPFGLDVLMAAQIGPARLPTDDDILLNGWPPIGMAGIATRGCSGAIRSRSSPVATTVLFVWSEVPDDLQQGFDPRGGFMAGRASTGFSTAFASGCPRPWGGACDRLRRAARLDLSSVERARIETMAIHAMRRAIDLGAPPASGNPLTRRERETLHWIAAGLTFAETAAIMRISEATVTSHLCAVRRKLDVANTTQAVSIAIDERLITPPPRKPAP